MQKFTPIALGLLIALGAPIASPPVHAAPQVAKSDAIPPMPLKEALRIFASREHLQFIYESELASNVRSQGAPANLPQRATLAALLRGTGLEYRYIDANTVTIARAKAASSSGSSAPTHASSEDPASGQGIQAPDVDSSASAANDGQDATLLQSVMVSASRIDFANVVAVTPTVSFTPESLMLPAYTNVGDALYDLPYFSASRGPSSTGTNINAGASPIDLRGLGVKRTLLLVDGHRVSGNTLLGGNDLNSIPSVFIKRVDVVTGGASASWGSGAVAGVVNIYLDHDFDGVKLDASYGQSSRSDDKTRSVSVAAGTYFAGGKGHAQIGGDFVKAGGILRRDRPRTARWGLLPVDGTRKLAFTPNVGLATQSLGGLITSGVLEGKAFAPDGSLHDHELERVVGTSAVGSNAPSSDDFSYVIVPRQHYTVLGSLGYDLSDDLRLTAIVRYFQSDSDYHTFSVGLQGLEMNADNAFLAPDIKQVLADAGESTFTLGRFRADINYPRYVTRTATNQETVKLDGKAGTYWRWTAYLSHGESKVRQATPGFFITQNLNRAIDAVVDPATGSIVCRYALANPGTDCVPIDLFGEGAPSKAAQDYVTGTSLVRRVRTSDEAGVVFRGQPWDLPAGPVGIAVGAEGRHVSVRQTVGKLDAEKALQPFVSSPEHGGFSVSEVFGEINVPLLKDKPGFQDLAVDLAARASNYSTSGMIGTWKVGVTNEFGHGVRARIGYSRDIRAPDLDELYQEQGQGANPVYDPVLNESYMVNILLGGNPNLRPEKANTLTVGASWAPTEGALNGLLLSADYYNIDIKDVITTVGTQATVDRCEAGNQSLCARIVRGADDRIEFVSSQAINLARFMEDGMDLEAAYRQDGTMFGVAGQYQAHLNATWVHKLTVSEAGNTINYAGAVGSSWIGNAAARWRSLLDLGFRSHRFSLGTRIRYLSSGYHQINANIMNNRIPQYFYFDVQGSYTFVDDVFTVYGLVRNVADKKPPIASGFSPFYDPVGRFFKVGVRLNF